LSWVFRVCAGVLGGAPVVCSCSLGFLREVRGQGVLMRVQRGSWVAGVRWCSSSWLARCWRNRGWSVGVRLCGGMWVRAAARVRVSG